MPVGDFPTVFPTIMTCRLNMVKQDGNLQKRQYTQTILHFFNILSCFFDHVFFWLIMSMFFLANTCIFCIFKLNNMMLHFFSAYHDIDTVYCSWKDVVAFTCIFCIFAVRGRHGTVENASIILEFSGVSGLNK